MSHLFSIITKKFYFHEEFLHFDINDDEGSLQFSPEAEFASPLEQTLKQNQCAWHNCDSVKKAC